MKQQSLPIDTTAYMKDALRDHNNSYESYHAADPGRHYCNWKRAVISTGDFKKKEELIDKINTKHRNTLIVVRS